ncbi:hypothetical protein [Mucisphaera calidilacus]|uniref:Uncharacterized protein n=1 Tax=Mucisphaera calidilacus TaxID=2527982 RepID=A0A518BZI2_9BACT|nr:hypothetical protein [Mucisphaera calidilacus]QDU72371.1 hypothetical protein Pan265_22360 [Mucisphaera calidilacus]
MNKLTPLLALLGAPAAALAHTGSHEMHPGLLFFHWLSQPDHLLIGLAGAVVGFGAAAILTRRSSRHG